MRTPLLLVFLVAAPAGLIHCAGDETTGGQGEAAGDEQELQKAPDKSHELFLGRWESTTKTVPKTGELPFETNIRSLEFKSERADSNTHARFRLVMVVRPGCSDCKDELIEGGTYRSIATSPSDLKKGKLFVTEGGNTSSRDFYEIDGDALHLTATGLGADNKTVTREFRRVK